MSNHDWRDDEVLPEQTSDDVDEPTSSEVVDEDLERFRREVPPHHEA